MKDIEAGVIRGLVLHKLDRFVREHGHLTRALAVAEAHNAVLASVIEPLDTSSPMDEATGEMMVTFARLEARPSACASAPGPSSRRIWGSLGEVPATAPNGYDDGLTVIAEEVEIIEEIKGLIHDALAFVAAPTNVTRRNRKQWEANS